LLNGIVGNVGGSINVVPKRAGDTPLIQFTPDYSMDSQFGGHLDVGRRFGDNKEFGVRFNGVYRDGNTTVDHLSRQTALATLGLDYRGERLRVDGDFGYQKAKVQGVRRFARMAAGIQVPEAPDNRTNWFDPAEFTGTEVLYGSLRGEFDVTDRLTAFAAFGGSESFQTRFSPNRTITSVLGTVAGGTFPGDASLQKFDSLSWLTGLRARLETGFVQHQIVFAYNTFEKLSGRSIASGAPGTPRPTSNIYNPVYGARPSFLTPSFGDTRKASDVTQSSFVAADTLSILEERVQLTIGGRAQQIKADNFNSASGVATSRYDENAISPSIALVVKPLQNVSIYGNYIQGLQQGPVAPLGSANAGQVFAPYSAEQYETGVKVDFGSLAATVALYQIALPSTYTDPSTNVFGINGDQRNRGIDFNLFGEVTPGFRVLGGVSYIDSVLLNTAGGINDGNRGIAVPRWRGVFGAEWDTPFIPGFTLTGRVIRNDSVFVDQANLQRLPAWTVLNIGARYRIERQGGQVIIIRASIDNALNSNHWESSNGNDVLILSEPRTFRISTSFNF
jgi:iron complex outermembrane receptor protein